MAEPREPVLGPEERAAFAKGVREFNQGCYFECHDTLEELWSGLRGESRDFFQALIQVAVGHYHVGNGNAAGARSMFERALARFAKYPARYFGFDVERQRRELRELLEDPASSGPDRPQWRFDEPASAAP